MRHLYTLFLAPAICLTLAADTTGGITGKVQAKDGKPVTNAIITLKRTDITYVKELKTDAKGKFIQVGLSPVEYDVTVHAEGFVDIKDHFKIPLGELKKIDFTLLTQSEAQAAAPANSAPLDPGAALEDAGSDAYNKAIGFYNEKNFKEAEPLVAKAYSSLKEASEKTMDEKAKQEVVDKLEKVSRTYGLVLYEVGQAEKSMPKLDAAKTLIEKSLQQNPKDLRLLDTLLNIAKEKGDKEGVTKYQAAIDEINGPRPENAYNEGVVAYNANKFKEAKTLMLKAIQIDSKFADSYYILGLIETNNNNLKAAKDAFKTCLELSPAGKHAAECKEFIKAL